MALPPLELFSLEREGRLLPGGLFVCANLHDGWRTRRASEGNHQRTRRITEVSCFVFAFVLLCVVSSWLCPSACLRASQPSAKSANVFKSGTSKSGCALDLSVATSPRLPCPRFP